MVIVITGPIASGKSTIAIELSRQLAEVGVRRLVIDLDAVHDEIVAGGLPSGDPAWALARSRAAERAIALSQQGATVVIAEGSFNLPAHRLDFVRELHRPDPVFVTLQVSLDEALRRVEQDPTRGRSRDPRFLRAYFAGRSDVLAAAPESDIVIDTGRTSVIDAAATIARIVRRSLA